MYWKTLLSAYSRAYPYLNFYLLIMSTEALKHKDFKGCCCLFYNFQLYVHWYTIQALLLSAVYACYYTNDYGKHFLSFHFYCHTFKTALLPLQLKVWTIIHIWSLLKKSLLVFKVYFLYEIVQSYHSLIW